MLHTNIDEKPYEPKPYEAYSLVGHHRQAFFRPLFPATAEPYQIAVAPALGFFDGIGTSHTTRTITVKKYISRFIR